MLMTHLFLYTYIYTPSESHRLFKMLLNSISKCAIFQIFWGDMPLDPPSGGMLCVHLCFACCKLCFAI